MSLRKKHIKFIEYTQAKTGLSLTAIAHAANLADSTLTRFISKADFKRLSSATLDKIAKVAGYKYYEDYLIQNHIENESESIEFSDSEKFETYEIVKNLLKKKKLNLSPEEVSSLTNKTLNTAKKLNTKFISESLVAYVLEGWRFEI